MRAAALASNRWLDRRAVPDNVSTSKDSRPMEPRSTGRNLMARFISPFFLDVLPCLCASRNRDV
eukprot:8635456-Pyramimonas_sp.AAC.1